MKIALIGSAPSSVGLAPYGDPSWKIWGCSPGAFFRVGRSDEWFEIHRWEPGEVGKPGTQVPWFSPEYVQWLYRHPRVWGFDLPKDMPGARMIPHETLRAKYGDFFFTSTVAWMFAMAIERIIEDRKGRKNPEPDVIGLWGVDMAACPSPETRVLTSDLRWVMAGDLNVGDKILAFDEEATPGIGGNPGKRLWREAEVLRADQIIKPCYRVFLEDGREIVCSDEHKWLTYAEHTCRWKMTKDLVTPHHRLDRPTRIVKLCDTWAEDKSWDAGYLAAAFDGEGHLSQKLREGDYGYLRAGFAQRDNAMLQEVKSVCRRLGFDLGLDSKDGGVNGDCHKSTLRGGRAKTLEFLGRIRPRRLLENFSAEHLGIMQKTGTVAVEKTEFIGEQPVVGLTTSTGTFVAEGLASHNSEEYGYQRSALQFFLQAAKWIAIETTLPPESDLMTPPPLYGLFECTHRGIKLTSRLREITNRLSEARQRKDVATREVTFLEGAVDDLTYQQNNWMGEGPPLVMDFGRLFGEKGEPEASPPTEDLEIKKPKKGAKKKRKTKAK